MFLKYKPYLKLFFISVVTLVLLTTSTVGLVVFFTPKVEIEELKPLTSKTITKERQKSQQATIASIIKVTEEVKASQNLNLDFVITTDKGEDLLVLINKKIRLTSTFVPSNLVDLNNFVAAYQGARLKNEAANAVKEMFEAAKQEKGISYSVVSAYRSYQDQVSVFNGWVASAGLKSAESFSAKAGHSQHQLGTTVDISVPGMANFSEAFGTSIEGIWLAENSYKFGYVLAYPKGKEKITGYSYEPWHFRYIGRENSQKMIESGLILEEFLQRFGTW